jgi:replicative DNA helicase
VNALARTHIVDVAVVEDARPTALVDLDAERAVLGALMLDAAYVAPIVSALLTAADFHEPRHALLWDVFAAVLARGEALDVLTAVAELRARNRLNTVGGPQALGELTDALPTVAHCESHALIVVEASRRRRLALIGERLMLAAGDPTREGEKLRDAAVDALRALRFGRGSTASSALDLVSDLMESVERSVAGARGPTPLAFGVPTLDRMSGGGMKRGGAYFIAARPGIGKTALACQVGGAVAAGGECVLYVALEPSRGEIMSATIANRAGVDLVKITRAQQTLTQDDVNDVTTAANIVAGWPLYVVDATERETPDTVARVEAVMRALPKMPALVVVDHLLKLQPTRRHERAHEGTGEVVAGLVSLGKRTGATLLVLCHIGRGVSDRGGLFRRPRAEDIAGGDAMNRDADGIILLHREDKYPTAKENVENPSVAGIVDMVAPKLRGVEDNTFGRMRFRGAVQRFEAMDAQPVATPKRAGWRDPDEDLDEPRTSGAYSNEERDDAAQ